MKRNLTLRYLIVKNSLSIHKMPELILRGLGAWSWPFVDYINLLKKRALYEDIHVGTHSNFKVKINEIFLY